ncbi:MAG: 23S rRNA (uracil(1939)-C(5))-methyltransferase RlmD [Firmicutes bacterium]|nr:23S rRNA (uracil(1939)-C(5))-methyltransferase RlmD [Bacillota bacterium]
MDVPVKKNKKYNLEVIDINHRGQGVCKKDGFAIFVGNGILGDKGTVKINKVKKNYAVGEMVKIAKPSKHRVLPKCPISYNCGGCQLQDLNYQKQLDIKTERVKNDMKRIGKMDDIIIHDTLGMDEPFRYRNKAQFPVRMSNNKLSIGFYKRGSHEVVDTKSCVIQHKANDKVIKLVKDFIQKYKITPYNEKSNTGIIRHILTKVSFATGDLMVVIITNGRNIPYKDKLIKTLTDKIPNIKSIIQNINNRKSNVILGGETKLLYGDEKIIDYIGDLKFKISAKSFYQVNPIQTKVLYQKALEYANLTGNETVFDLYCGIGTISLFLSKKAKKVYGIEVVKEAILDAKENAKENNINNTEFYDGTAEEIFPKLYNKGVSADVVVIDPPRKGCDEAVLDTIVKMKPKRVVYVSCNPATLARDLKYLNESDYITKEIQPVDMFPHTMHVECVALIERK